MKRLALIVTGLALAALALIDIATIQALGKGTEEA